MGTNIAIGDKIFYTGEKPDLVYQTVKDLIRGANFGRRPKDDSSFPELLKRVVTASSDMWGCVEMDAEEAKRSETIQMVFYDEGTVGAFLRPAKEAHSDFERGRNAAIDAVRNYIRTAGDDPRYRGSATTAINLESVLSIIAGEGTRDVLNAEGCWPYLLGVPVGGVTDGD